MKIPFDLGLVVHIHTPSILETKLWVHSQPGLHSWDAVSNQKKKRKEKGRGKRKEQTFL